MMGKVKDSSTNWSTHDEAGMGTVDSCCGWCMGDLQPLTNDQIYIINREVWNALDQANESYCIKLARAIERAHGIEVQDDN